MCLGDGLAPRPSLDRPILLFAISAPLQFLQKQDILNSRHRRLNVPEPVVLSCLDLNDITPEEDREERGKSVCSTEPN